MGTVFEISNFCIDCIIFFIQMWKEQYSVQEMVQWVDVNEPNVAEPRVSKIKMSFYNIYILFDIGKKF